jgi:alpha-tubulin suppressor-like RCC1 family protein
MPVNEDHTLVLSAEKDRYYACGRNNFGSLGTGDCEWRTTFTLVEVPVRFLTISAGGDHSVAISELDGSLWGWGSNSFGQAGFPRVIDKLLVPTQVANTSSFYQISTGCKFTLALNNNGDVWSYGSNQYGELGQSASFSCLYVLLQLLVCQILHISAGGNHSIVVDIHGDVWMFGAEQFYNRNSLGNHNFSPVKLATLKNIIQVSSGFAHNLAVDSDYHVWAWGSISMGNLASGALLKRQFRLERFQDWKMLRRLSVVGIRLM